MTRPQPNNIYIPGGGAYDIMVNSGCIEQTRVLGYIPNSPLSASTFQTMIGVEILSGDENDEYVKISGLTSSNFTISGAPNGIGIKWVGSSKNNGGINEHSTNWFHISGSPNYFEALTTYWYETVGSDVAEDLKTYIENDKPIGYELWISAKFMEFDINYNDNDRELSGTISIPIIYIPSPKN